MGLESIKMVKAKELPESTRDKYKLPSKGLLEARTKRNPLIKIEFKPFKIGDSNMRKELRENNLLFFD